MTDGNKKDLRLSWAGRSREVRVREIRSSITAARSTTLRISFDALERSDNYHTRFSVGSLGPDDLIERRIREVLFGEKNRHERDFDFID